MLEHLFSSRTRVKLLKTFLLNPEEKYYVRQLTRDIDERINSVRRELENLVNIGMLITFDQHQRKYYQVNTDFVLFSEMTTLFVKSRSLLEAEILDSLKTISQIQYCVLTGTFVQNDDVETDLFIVGDDLPVNKLKKTIKQLEQHFNREINYTLMSLQEFRERSELTDRFIYNIVNNPKITVVDKLFKGKTDDQSDEDK
ncbi:MAG: hypothetical protein ACPGO5_05235 [Patescibacteria group bacterium]